MHKKCWNIVAFFFQFFHIRQGFLNFAKNIRGIDFLVFELRLTLKYFLTDFISELLIHELELVSDWKKKKLQFIKSTRRFDLVVD